MKNQKIWKIGGKWKNRKCWSKKSNILVEKIEHFRSKNRTFWVEKNRFFRSQKLWLRKFFDLDFRSQKIFDLEKILISKKFRDKYFFQPQKILNPLILTHSPLCTANLCACSKSRSSVFRCFSMIFELKPTRNVVYIESSNFWCHQRGYLTDRRGTRNQVCLTPRYEPDGHWSGGAHSPKSQES